MTVVNGTALLQAAPIKNMACGKLYEHGVSHGLGEAGFDIRIKQRIVFSELYSKRVVHISEPGSGATKIGRFVLASAIEEFDMPDNLVGIVHDKSTWARQGLSVFNTVIESGWKGFLTLELVYHGEDTLVIPAGSGIAQVIFHETSCRAQYTGRYNNQADEPVPAIKA